MSDFILEIGTEEIPARFLENTQKELIRQFSEALSEANLAFEAIKSYATPRRAVLHIQNLAEKQDVKEETFSGPAQKIAYQEDGALSKAAQGFLRGHNAKEEDIFLLETEKGVYIAIKKMVGGLSAKEVLENICPKIILSLPFPKKMRWGSSRLTYARPIHWILALLDSTVVNFKIDALDSSNQIDGHRIHGQKARSIASTAEYFQALKDESIVLDAEDRKNTIINLGNAAAEKINGKVLWKDSLLDEVKGLVEFPLPIIGDFDPSFLEVPREALLTSMESHQKSFGIEDANGNLMPHFLTILNLEPKDISLVKQGWERVLRARLEDARFFWKTDNALLEAEGFNLWREKLNKVIFLGPLGSIGDKSERMSKLMGDLAAKLNLDINLAVEAGQYAKVDLVSSMVNEFDTLQGIMGGIYAKVIGKEALGDAIREHYLPAGPETPVPTNDYAALLSLCDKVDTLVGLFGLNNIPTGAADPYALRRCALGLARILRDKEWNIEVTEIFALAYSHYSSSIAWKLDKENCLEKLKDFYFARVKNLLLNEGHDTFFVDAILHTKESTSLSMSSLMANLLALESFAKHTDYISIVQSYKRVANIIRKQAESYTLSDAIDANLFENDDEKALFAKLSTFKNDFASAFSTSDFAKCYALLIELAPAIDAFFNSTMVMAEDEKVRLNRLNLLNGLQQAQSRLIDIAALQI